MRTDAVGWREYLAEYHAEHPGITERLFSFADASPYQWVAEAAGEVGATGRVIDLACGSAPTRRWLTTPGWIGVDQSTAELAAAAAVGRGPVVRARADRLPFADDFAADAVVAAMSLQVVRPLAGVLSEISRVLRPGGCLIALLPSDGLPLREARKWLPVFTALGIVGLDWPNPEMTSEPAQVLTGHGFTLVSDQRRTFPVELPMPEGAGLVVSGLYLPTLAVRRRAAAVRRLATWSQRGLSLPMAMRRVVVTRQASTG